MFLDGVQFVTGCTIGNKSITFISNDNTSLTISKKGKSELIKVQIKPFTRSYIAENFPEFTTLKEKLSAKKEKTTDEIVNIRALALEAAFKIIELDPEELFTIEVSNKL